MMFEIGDTLVYRGHGLVKVAAIPTTTKLGSAPDGADVTETYYVLKSARTPLATTKLMVRVDRAEGVLRTPVGEEEARALIEAASTEAAELPEDPKERVRILDAITAMGDIRELASLVRDYRETKLLNLERTEVKRIKAIARDIAEEICHVLKVKRAALKGKFTIRAA